MWAKAFFINVIIFAKNLTFVFLQQSFRAELSALFINALLTFLH